MRNYGRLSLGVARRARSEAESTSGLVQTWIRTYMRWCNRYVARVLAVATVCALAPPTSKRNPCAVVPITARPPNGVILFDANYIYPF